MSFDERDYVGADATGLAAAVRHGLVSPLALLTFAIERAHRLQPALGGLTLRRHLPACRLR